MSRLANASAAKRFLRETTKPFITQAGLLTVLQMRRNVSGETSTKVSGIRPITDIAGLLRLRRQDASPLTDTGDLARVLSLGWHNEQKLHLALGPIGTTSLSTEMKLDTISAHTAPGKLSGKKSAISYAKLAWLHEHGYSVRVTDKMVNMFHLLATRGGDREPTSALQRGAMIMYRHLTTRELQSNGRWRRVPKQGMVLTTPARPFMHPAMEDVNHLLRYMFPKYAGRIFTGWVSAGPWGQPYVQPAREVVRVRPPTHFVTFGIGTT